MQKLKNKYIKKKIRKCFANNIFTLILYKYIKKILESNNACN